MWKQFVAGMAAGGVIVAAMVGGNGENAAHSEAAPPAAARAEPPISKNTGRALCEAQADVLMQRRQSAMASGLVYNPFAPPTADAAQDWMKPDWAPAPC